MRLTVHHYEQKYHVQLINYKKQIQMTGCRDALYEHVMGTLKQSTARGSGA